MIGDSIADAINFDATSKWYSRCGTPLPATGVKPVERPTKTPSAPSIRVSIGVDGQV